MTTGPVVAAVDGSEESLRAVEWAALEAGRHRSPLRIVSAPALPPHLVTYCQRRPAAGVAARRLSSRALSDAVVRAEELAPDLLIATDLLSVGPPAVSIADCGSSARMLVLGARGTGDFSVLLLGSVSRYAAMHASCPVVVARQENDAVHREIVAAVRDPGGGDEVLAFAFAEAALRRASVVVTHSWQWPAGSWRGPAGQIGGAGPERPPDAGDIPAEVSETLARTIDGWRRTYPGVPVRQDVARCHPARLLVSYSVRADLVVIGRHGKRGGAAIGAIQHAVLAHARGPVAVVPADT